MTLFDVVGASRPNAMAGTPAWLVNTIEHGNGESVVAGLGQFRRLWVRDGASHRSLERAGIKAEIVPDLTLSWREAPLNTGDGTALFVTDSSEKAKSTRLLALARRADARLVSLRTTPPKAADGWSNPRRRGLAAKRLIAAMVPLSPWSARYALAFGTFEDLAFAFATNAAAVICGRYHGVCLGMRTRTPFLAITGNTSKIGDLLSDAGLSQRLTTLDDLEAPLRVPPFTAEERAALEAFLVQAEQGAASMIETIARDLRSPGQVPAGAPS